MEDHQRLEKAVAIQIGMLKIDEMLQGKKVYLPLLVSVVECIDSWVQPPQQCSNC